MTISVGIIVALVILGLLNIGAIIWLIIEIVEKNKCQSTESLGCPSYACEKSDSDCNLKPFRYVNGVKTCQPYLTDTALPKYNPADVNPNAFPQG